MRSISSFQISGSLLPLRREAEHVLRWRLRRERFQPAHRCVADVGKRMHTTYSGPKHIACPGQIPLPVENSLDLAAQKEVTLFEGMIVQPDVRAGQIFDKQQAMMTGAEFLVDQPSQKHAFGSRKSIACGARRRDLAGVEMAEQRFDCELDLFRFGEKRV